MRPAIDARFRSAEDLHCKCSSQPLNKERRTQENPRPPGRVAAGLLRMGKSRLPLSHHLDDFFMSRDRGARSVLEKVGHHPRHQNDEKDSKGKFGEPPSGRVIVKIQLRRFRAEIHYASVDKKRMRYGRIHEEQRMCQRTMRCDGIEEEGNLFGSQELNGSPNDSRQTPMERRKPKGRKSRQIDFPGDRSFPRAELPRKARVKKVLSMEQRFTR